MQMILVPPQDRMPSEGLCCRLTSTSTPLWIMGNRKVRENEVKRGMNNVNAVWKKGGTAIERRNKNNDRKVFRGINNEGRKEEIVKTQELGMKEECMKE